MSERFSDAPARGLPDRSNQLRDRPAQTIAKLRDAAIIGVLKHADPSINAVIALRVQDYYSVGNRRWLRVVKDGIERQQLVDVKLECLIDKYLLASDIVGELSTPLFRSTLSGSGRASNRSVHRYHVARLARQIRNLKSARLTPDTAELLINAIKPISKENLRDRAIIGLMLYVSATPREIATFRAAHYLDNGQWCCIKLSRSRILEVPDPLRTLLRDYVRAENPQEDSLLFRVNRSRGMTATNVEQMIRRRLKETVATAGRQQSLHRRSDSN